MKRIISLGAIALLVALVPGLVLAAELRGGEQVTISRDQTIDNDVYLSGGSVEVDGTVTGDLVMTGGEVRLTGRVNGDLIVAGGQINVTGSVGDDIRAAGGQVTLDGAVGDDLIVVGGEVRVGADATVAGDAKIGAGTATIAGKVQAVEAGVGDLRLTSTAVVAGNLSYYSDHEARIDQGATISGQIERKTVPMPEGTNRQADKIWTALLGTIMTAIFAYLFIVLFPTKTAKTVELAGKHSLLSFLLGFIFLIVVPVLAVLLMVTVVGIPLGIMVFLLYPLYLYLGYLVSALIAGAYLERIFERRSELHFSFPTAVLGAIIMTLLGLLTYVGPIIIFILTLVGLGALVRTDWTLWQDLRNEKKI